MRKLVKLEKPDVLCIQEVKASKKDFPYDDVKALGFEYIALNSMAGYNGVAILSKLPLNDIEEFHWVGKKDARHVKAVLPGDIELHNIYVPAGGDVPDPIENISFAHKLTFMDDISEAWEKDAAMKKKKLRTLPTNPVI